MTCQDNKLATRVPAANSGGSAYLLILILSLPVLLSIYPAPIQAAALQLVDDSNQPLTLAAPARRIISLAPNITELLYAAGAGAYIVGTISHSDYPPPALQIPRIGDYSGLDMEAILNLKPDLIVAWPGGNPQAQLQKLQQMGLPVYNAEPHRLEDIPRTIEQLGYMAATTTEAGRSAADFRRRLQVLQQQYQGRSPVRVFFQVWEQPLFTINGQQLISDVIERCGGKNIFAELPTLAPQINIEAVLQANPEVIITSTSADEATPAALRHWRNWEGLAASHNGHLYGIPAEQISRHTPRILDGMQRLCNLLQQVRQQRDGINQPP
jgi:iron complex transport system substrate-binding protein